MGFFNKLIGKKSGKELEPVEAAKCLACQSTEGFIEVDREGNDIMERCKTCTTMRHSVVKKAE